jgi:hypothetical protein
MKYLHTYNDIDINIKYSIEYTTRKSENGHIGSKELLENIDNIDLTSTSYNIDELFIKKSYSIIKEWFNDDKRKMMSFATKLQQDVTIIWYEVDDCEDSVSIFTRLNIGKINLTNAELVKALFLSRGRKNSEGRYAGNPYGIEEKKQHEIALGWDSMEKELHNEKFWTFITNKKSDDYPVRMELLFDMIEMKPDDESNFYTFNRFYERFKNSNDKYNTWELIERYMQQLKEWYNDFDLFHLIGFLVATGTTIKSLLDIALNIDNPIKKSAFRIKVLGMIRERMIFKAGEKDSKEELDYAELNYEQHSEFIHYVLLLFNVETIRQKGDENIRFPDTVGSCGDFRQKGSGQRPRHYHIPYACMYNRGFENMLAAGRIVSCDRGGWEITRVIPVAALTGEAAGAAAARAVRDGKAVFDIDIQKLQRTLADSGVLFVD